VELYEQWSDLTIQGVTLRLAAATLLMSSPQNSDGQVSLQLFINACTNDQQQTYDLLSLILQNSVSSYISTARGS
jgi:hypothetical protein